MLLTEQAAHRKDQDAGYANMQHRHFATVAKIIKAIPLGEVRKATAHHFATHLRQTNPKFDHDRFMRACELL